LPGRGIGASSLTESSGIGWSADFASSASFARQAGPLWRISFTLCGGFGPCQADAMSISPFSVSIPQETDLSLEYVTNFIACPYTVFLSQGE
jgi:hypothetical protein